MIDLYVVSVATKKICATGFIAKSEKEEYRHVLKLRPEMTLNRAEIEGATFALESIKPEFRGEEVRLHTRSTYAIGFTTKKANGDWSSYPSKNVELVERFRATVETLKNLNMVKIERTHNMVDTIKAIITKECDK
jgi:ribonuclease HI